MQVTRHIFRQDRIFNMLLAELMDTTKTEEGSYIAVKLSKETQDRLADFANSFKIENIVPREKFHITVIYSTKSVPKTFKALGDIDPPILAQPKHLTIFETKGGSSALVLELDCPELVKRHNDLMSKYNLKYDFPEYKVHVTLSYDVGDWEIPTVVDYKDIQDLEIVNEYLESLKLDWVKTNTGINDENDSDA